MRALGARAATPPAAPHAAAIVDRRPDRRLHDLHESGALTDEEYAQAKQLALT